LGSAVVNININTYLHSPKWRNDWLMVTKAMNDDRPI